MLCAPGKEIATLFDGPGQEQSKKARPVRSLFESLLNMLNMVIPPIVPTYICISSINRY